MKIKTVVCPDVRVPEDIIGKKRPRPSSSENRSSVGYFSRGALLSTSNSCSTGPQKQKNRYGNAKRGSEKSQLQNEIRSIYTEIKDFSSQSFIGMEKKKHKEDKLTKLGAPPTKEQKIPFKMKMGILAGRKKRDDRTIEIAKESGVVLAKNVIDKANNAKDKKRKDNADKDRDEIGPKTFGGILHIGKNFLSKVGGGGRVKF